MNGSHILDNRILKGVYQREDIYLQQGMVGTLLQWLYQLFIIIFIKMLNRIAKLIANACYY